MQFLTSPLLESLPHVYHGFGLRSKELLEGVVFPKQVHGKRVAVLEGTVSPAWHEEADAVIVTQKGLPIGVRTADCLPILLADDVGRAVAVVHAGWRGTALGIVPAAIRRLGEVTHLDPDRFYMAVGPGIGPCCMEVDIPVKDFFLENGQKEVWNLFAKAGRPDHWYLDLQAMVKYQAIKEGVKEERLDVLIYCTSCEKDYFYSYRREGLAAGRQANYIVLKAEETER